MTNLLTEAADTVVEATAEVRPAEAAVTEYAVPLAVVNEQFK
jgi:hypothetical protein